MDFNGKISGGSLGHFRHQKRDLDPLVSLSCLPHLPSGGLIVLMVGGISWINGWGNCGPIKPQKQSQKLYAVTNSLNVLICGGIERVARRYFEINEFLMTLEFFQGICSLNLISGFYMLAPKIDKASSYVFFSFYFQAYWYKWIELFQSGCLLISFTQ